jgi:hypothetical protein
MIEKFADLGLTSIDKIEVVDKLFQEKLGISFQTMTEALSTYVQANAEELSEQFINVAPYGDYSKLLEDKSSISLFFREEAHKPENWQADFVGTSKNSLIEIGFKNTAVDDGTNMEGFVFVSFGGIIRYAFAQGDE